MLNLIFQAIWFILPAYCANIAPVFFAKALAKYNHPLDFGKSWKGKRIFGDGKTWPGLISGTLVGGLAGFLQSLTLIQPVSSLQLGLLLGFGALTGDFVGSFIKRRIGLARGQSLPLMDQLGFIIFAFLFSLILIPFNWKYFIICLILTPVLHLGTNWIGFKLKLKREPW